MKSNSLSFVKGAKIDQSSVFSQMLHLKKIDDAHFFLKQFLPSKKFTNKNNSVDPLIFILVNDVATEHLVLLSGTRSAMLFASNNLP